MTTVSPANPGPRRGGSSRSPHQPPPDPVGAVLAEDEALHPSEPWAAGAGEGQGSEHFQPHLPHRFALDGIRGLAVLAVVIYHLELEWLPGGFLGVSLFFTLSGFLITNLVLAEESATRALHLGSFWARRARRLIPAMLATLALVVAFGWFAADADQLRRLGGDVWSSLLYVTNWRFIVEGDVYGAGYQEPSPLAHFWSLAIEEQFYVVFPLVALVLVRRGAGRAAWFGVFGAVLAGSMVATLVLYDPTDTARIYFGTDTRMAELVAGVLLAVAVRMELPAALRRLPGRTVLAALPLVASVGLWLWVDLSQQWLYRGGFWLVALVSCGLVLVALDRGPVTALLSVRPLVWLGLVSYGIYLYHWPIFRWLDESSTGLDGAALAALRLAVTLAVAVASYQLIEQPIRRRRLALTTPVWVTALLVSAAALALASWQLAGEADERAVGDASDLAILDGGGPSTTLAPSQPVTEPPPPVERVLFMGDSLVHQAYPGFEAHFSEQGIETMAVGGPGETLLEHRDEWLAELADAVATFDPDVVVLEACCGYGDLVDRRQWTTDDGVVLELDTPELWAEWRAVAAQATEIAGSNGAVPLWVLAPPAQTNGYYGPIEGRIPVANELYRDLSACFVTVGLADWSVVSGPDGEYTATMPDAAGDEVKVRVDDGLHFTPEGADLLANLTDESLQSAWASLGGRLDPADRPVAAACR